VIKRLFNLILRAGLLSLVVCAISLIAEANTGAKIIQFKSTSVPESALSIDLKTMNQSVEALKKASEYAQDMKQAKASDEILLEAKKNMLAAIDSFGSYQFPSGYLDRTTIDTLITTLLAAFPLDSEITDAVVKKLAELSHTIFSRATGDSFLRFLNYQVHQQISMSQTQEWTKFLTLFENSKPHASQLETLTLFFKNTTDPSVKIRAFNQIYTVLIDPELHWLGQFSPTFLILTVLRTFVAEDHSQLTPAQYKKIFELITKAENTNQMDIISQNNLIRLLMRYAEKSVEFEERLIQRVNSLSQFDTVIRELNTQIEMEIPLTPVQKNIVKNLKLNSIEHIQARRMLLGEITPAKIIPFRRAAPACHSFYGGN